MEILKINAAAAKEDPRMVLMGVINCAQFFGLLGSFGMLVAQMVNGPDRLSLAIGTILAGIGILLWIVTTSVGALQYSKQIIAKRGIDELLGMTEALQSADSHEDTATVLKATSLELLPEFGGALYVFNNSRDRLDLAGHWNVPSDFVLSETLAPSNCWALKRGKHHVNHGTSTKLRCAHHGSGAATLEIPMIARGTVYGLLMFIARDAPDTQKRLAVATRAAHAMADAMSLALSNIALRERLQMQSIRDPLTGLFNRRYMEDALERYVSLAERSGTPLSVLMFDLDNFKRLNDEHGHAKGDAVLRDVAGEIVGGLGNSDVTCRYGGEELIAILPDCSLDEAASRAEAIRCRIERLSENHGVSISASIGVSSFPETCSRPSELVVTADKMLYAAKSAGKNRVEKAGSRDVTARLTVAR
ncbi:GGDEF domain-containing protein [Novosphingobium sp. JCM 18896]|uniref:GGDEF domain-containing protein n=1 Tax=Novosphingobium sp. JCM 18896 TaxID=2989731 RepID=UPI0022227454|nr:GGDEF domain-containing protein [Novosphingobium sp. JCM 18896]MCW1431719.1 GGDEF domain-containing protein [Novosphingobium sp. JCM 18896]